MYNLLILFLAIALLPTGISRKFATTIQKSNGQTMEGEIRGTIVLKSSVTEVQKDSKKYGVVVYVLTKGSYFATIGPKAVTLHKRSDIALVMLAWELGDNKTPPSDIEVLRAGAKQGDYANPLYAITRFGIDPLYHTQLESGALLVRFNGEVKKLISVNDILGSIPQTFIGDSPAFLARPQLAELLGEFTVTDTTKEYVLVPELQVITKAGDVHLKTSEIAVK